MIYDVFLPFIIIFSIFSIIIILARKIPDISLETEAEKDCFMEEAKKQHRMTILFCRALSILEKTLRQLRIHILKLDAKIFTLIQYLREKSAKRLEEINRLTYKSFVPAIEKKVGKTQSRSVIKVQITEKVAIPVATIKMTSAVSSVSVPKSVKIQEYPNKVSVKAQFDIEEKKLLHIIAKNPKNAENYKKLGILYYKNENFLDAEASFDEYLKLNPSDNQVREIARKVVLINKKNKNVISE